MKTILELRVENKGHLVGTSGWLKDEVFKDAYLSIRKLKDGYPGLFLVGKNKKGEETKDIICFVDVNYCEGYQDHGKNIFSIYPESDEYRHGFVGHFTDAAREIFDNFIDECVKLLQEFWESDTVDFEVNVKKL